MEQCRPSLGQKPQSRFPLRLVLYRMATAGYTMRNAGKEELMSVQLARPEDKVEVYWFSEQPNGYVTNELLDQ